MTSAKRSAMAIGILLSSFLALSVVAQYETAGQLNTWTTHPVSRRNNQSSYVRVVRVAKQRAFDRVVFEFAGPVPNYRLEYLRSKYFEDESGRHRIRIAGTAFIHVSLNMISADETQVRFMDAPGFVPKGKLKLPAVAQVEERTLFEGFYDFLIGVNGRKAFRVSELANPSRLVIDFKH